VGAAYFYHLTRQPLDQALPALLGRARAAGWRVAVRGTNANSLARLDETLWTAAGDSFLPHGLAGGPHDADQPILLTVHSDAANNPSCVMSIEGADVTPGEVTALERVCIIFDGNDTAALQVARGQWKTLKEAGCSAQYWSEDSGRWEKKAET
jgi:DNA polymerase-3 subunit chi